LRAWNHTNQRVEGQSTPNSFAGALAYGRKALANRPTKSHRPDARASTKMVRSALSGTCANVPRTAKADRFSNCRRATRAKSIPLRRRFSDARRPGYGVEKEHRTPRTRSASDSWDNARAVNPRRRTTQGGSRGTRLLVNRRAGDSPSAARIVT